MSYLVIGDGPEFGVEEEGGGIIYDNLTSRQEAEDIAVVLNAGIGPEWDEVEPALERLVIRKELR